jgi:hypothetical protein
MIASRCSVSKADQRVQVAGAASPARPVLSSSAEMSEFREEEEVASLDLE